MQQHLTPYIHPGLDRIFSAGRPLVLVKTQEEDRLARLLQAFAQRDHRPFWIWTATDGLLIDNERVTGSREPSIALAYLREQSVKPLVWFKDLYQHYEPTVVRALRDLYYGWRESGAVLILSAPVPAMPPGLERELVLFELDLPTAAEILAEIQAWTDVSGVSIDLPPATLVATLKGLTLGEIRHALNSLKHPDSKDALTSLQQEKRRLIQRFGTIEYIPRVPAISQLGGLENLKDWLLKRRQLLLSDDEELRAIAPKGILLMGVSGCGKSLCIKAISSAWTLPLYRLDMSRVFSGAYGSPELAFSESCRLMEEMAPAILWIDEIEMGLAAEGASAADSVLSRIFAFFLTWMQEKAPGLFVAATANRIDLLPAEMIRKGRFDQVFFVDLPTCKERENIFGIHLATRGYSPEAFSLEVFADGTDGWSGAEIEQCVVSAVTNAKMEGRALELKDLYASRKQIVPISTTMEEQVRHIRNWAYERAVRASAES